MQIRSNVPLREFSTFKTGGSAAWFTVVTNEAELTEAVAYARAHDLSLTVLAGGSNVLIPDEGIPGLVVQMQIKGVEIEETSDSVYLTVGAGEVFDEVVAETVHRGYWGLENLSHIPGSVGATPIQNVGAYGVEVGSLISLVRVYDTELETFMSLAASDCAFSYRHSLFKTDAGAQYIVTAVTFMLSKTSSPQLAYKDLTERFKAAVPTQQEIRDAVIDIRSKKFPDWRTVGTAGSFFKNPVITEAAYKALTVRYPLLPGYAAGDMVKVPLGWILEHVLGVKGEGTTTVGCYAGQALVLYNRGGASTTDVLTFADELAERVYEAIGITIESEVTLLK
jgi:UDP-N-acetylmuramate dehydrogenase